MTASTYTVEQTNGRTITLPTDTWTAAHTEAFQEGQCVAFACMLAAHTPGAEVRIVWRYDSEEDEQLNVVSHAYAVLPAQNPNHAGSRKRIIDSYSSDTEGQWYSNWTAHRGEVPEYEDFNLDTLLANYTTNPTMFDYLPAQDFNFAAAALNATNLPLHIRNAV